MERNLIWNKCWLAAGAAMLALSLTANAATEKDLAVQAKRMDNLSASRGGTVVSDRISGDFSSFAGSPENAQSLVNGLRNGTEVRLASPAAPPASFTPPTGKMGYGNVFISLALAKQSLAAQGITQPTPEQLRTAMLGGQMVNGSGQLVQTQGVLAMRAEGMGWGQIAHSMGFKLGQAVSTMKSANARLEPPAVRAASTPAGTHGSKSGMGLVTPAGKGEQAAGKGIVTGTGESTGAPLGKGGQGVVGGAGGSQVHGKSGDDGRGQGAGKP